MAATPNTTGEEIIPTTVYSVYQMVQPTEPLCCRNCAGVQSKRHEAMVMVQWLKTMVLCSGRLASQVSSYTSLLPLLLRLTSLQLSEHQTVNFPFLLSSQFLQMTGQEYLPANVIAVFWTAQ